MVGWEGKKKESIGVREGFSGRRCGDVVWHAVENNEGKAASLFGLSILHAVGIIFSLYSHLFLFLAQARREKWYVASYKHKAQRTMWTRPSKVRQIKGKRKNCCQERCWKNYSCWMQGYSLGDKNGLFIPRWHYFSFGPEFGSNEQCGKKRVLVGASVSWAKTRRDWREGVRGKCVCQKVRERLCVWERERGKRI